MGPGTMIGHHTQMPAGPAEVIRHRVAVLADDARGARSRNSHWHGRAERQDGDANFFATPAAIVADGLRHVRIQALRLNARDDRCRTRKALKELNFEEVAERESGREGRNPGHSAVKVPRTDGRTDGADKLDG